MNSGVGAAGLKLLSVCRTNKSQALRSSLAAATALPLACGSSGKSKPGSLNGNPVAIAYSRAKPRILSA